MNHAKQLRGNLITGGKCVVLYPWPRDFNRKSVNDYRRDPLIFIKQGPRALRAM